MVDSTVITVFVGVFEEKVAAGSKSAVLNTARRPRGSRWTPTSTSCSRPFLSRPTISCPEADRTLHEGSQTPRSSRCACRRRSWESRLTDGCLLYTSDAADDLL